MGIKEYEREVNKLNTRNFRFVSVKDERVCNYCKEVIPKGNKALTVNPKRSKRYWLCRKCISAYLNVEELSFLTNSVPFDDEGGYLALSEALSEAEVELELRRHSEDTFYIHYSK